MNSFEKPIEEQTEFYCSHCGKKYKRLKNNFLASQSPLYKNTKYMPICKKCVAALFDYYKEKLGNEKQAVRRICMKFDIWFSEELYKASKNVSKDYTRITSYIARSNLLQYAGKTYDDTIADEENLGVIKSESDLEEIKDDVVSAPSSKNIKTWGFGYEPDEYKMLDEHYKMLMNQFANADGVQDALIKDLCVLNVFKQRAVKQQKVDEVDKIMKMYHSTMKAGGLKPRTATEGIDDEGATWGTFIRDVENYSPADIYKDKKMFKDFEGVKEYFDRFILRPMKNFFSGQTIPDDEFSIKIEENSEMSEVNDE